MAALFVALSFVAAWRTLELKVFDLLTVATAPNESKLPIVIVGIDEESFAHVGRQWPWPRSVYARALDQLSQSGAMVVAFDMLFSEPDREAAEDKAFAEAIARNGSVVLAADMLYMETAHARQWMRVEPVADLKRAGGLVGFARIDLDRDVVARRMPTERDAFWRSIAQRIQEKQPGIPIAEPLPGDMIRYAGPVRTFTYVSFYQLVQGGLPPGAFQDQVVLIGKHVQASPDVGAAQSDLFLTPFTGTTRWFTPGVEIHANILETALRGDAIRPVDSGWIVLMILASVAAAVASMRTWRPLVSGVAAGGLTALMGGAAWLLFTRFNLWLPIVAPAAAIAFLYLIRGALAFLTEQRRRTELRRAFSLYVSPEVVDHVMANPKRLVLGGERRDVTMMFTDLAGFTTITEQHGAEQVTRILNMHFSRATAIVKRHGGTVNRFIGDAIMAMWGAPLDDPEQALHAVQAACEMQDDIARLREELKREGLPPIAMRIGVHSCNAIIGNLGSSDRFDYTAIGDGVNLAARMEGVNKLYGTGILLSGDTVALLRGQLRVRCVDRVIVKGKTEPVDLYTPCRDEAACDWSAKAMAAYRKREWAASEEAWARVLERLPDDKVAQLHLDRIAACKAMPANVQWQDAVELEKL